jgi:alpha-L-rhamnosidase
MRSLVLVLFAAATTVAVTDAQDFRVEVTGAEYQLNPVGIDVRTPRLSWRIVSNQRATMQRSWPAAFQLNQNQLVWSTV